MNYMNGGQLHFHLKEQAIFNEALTNFYAAEVVLALEYLHSIDVIHSDLKTGGKNNNTISNIIYLRTFC